MLYSAAVQQRALATPSNHDLRHTHLAGPGAPRTAPPLVRDEEVLVPRRVAPAVKDPGISGGQLPKHLG
jgi:hypothetical protein